jgi:hypothetical protein
MTRPYSPTTVVGAIAAAATAGALIAMGHRAGGAGSVFAAIASVLGRSGGNVFVGVVVHTALIFVWSAICVWLATRLRSQLFAAAVVAIANFLLATLVASSSGRGLASELTLGDRLIYAVVLTASLIVGMRYAFLHPRETATS